MFLTYKYVLLPTKRQRQELDAICEEQRQLYNGALWARNWAYEKTKRVLTLFDQCKELAKWRQSDQEASRLSSNLQRWTLRRLDNAFKAFLKRAKNKSDRWGKPRYRSSERWHSFGFAEFAGIALKNNRIKFKGLSSSIRVHFHRPFPKNSEIKSCIFTKIANHWYIAFQVKVDSPEKLSAIESAIGIDVGLNNFIFGSDGRCVPNPRFARKAERKIAECNRKLARCKRGSNRRKKVKLQLTKAHLAVKNARRTFLHQWSRALVDKYDLICHEDLKVANMAKSNMNSVMFLTGRYLLSPTQSNVRGRGRSGPWASCRKCRFAIKLIHYLRNILSRGTGERRLVWENQTNDNFLPTWNKTEAPPISLLTLGREFHILRFGSLGSAPCFL